MGRNLIASRSFDMPVKAVARAIPSDANLSRKGITWFAADLMNPSSLDSILDPGDIVINLAYMPSFDQDQNLSLIDNIVEACHRCRISRLVHCSTAVVVGAALTSRVDETTPCVPVTPYERTKYQIEKHILLALTKGIDVGILRPTAIVGPRGQNLLKLARSLQNGNWAVNYLRACLFGARPMHLVPVRNVASALVHLATFPKALAGDVYIVSSDDDPDNNFHDIEMILSKALGLGCRNFPLVPFPKQVLSLLLRLLGRSEANMQRVYDSGKLRAVNFKPEVSVAEAVREFAESFQTNRT